MSMLDFIKPEMAFRMFLARFGTPETVEELRGTLRGLELDAEDVQKLIPVLEMACEEMKKRDNAQKIAA